jgi:putative phage repressor|nr:MAG TPA: Repressor protein CI [Caudoviricetes sp.]
MNETRKQRVRQLIDERFGGRQVDFARAVGKKQAQVTHWLTDQRPIGNGIASDIETALNLPRGWLDGKDGSADTNNNQIAAAPAHSPDTVRIDHIDIAGQCGPGAMPEDYPEVIRSIEFPLETIRRLFGGSNMSGLRVVGTLGDSMEPTIPERSAGLIDTRVKNFAGDGIYFFFYNGYLYTKRLQITPQGLKALSDNNRYEPFFIDDSDTGTFRIIGKYYGVISVHLF